MKDGTGTGSPAADFRRRYRRSLVGWVALTFSACGGGQGHQQPGDPLEAPRPPVDCRPAGLVCLGVEAGVWYTWPDAVESEQWRKVAECTVGLEAPGMAIPKGPVIRFVPKAFEVQGILRNGWTDFYTGQITVVYPWDQPHEFVHYTLLRIGFDWQRNADHQSEAFNKCISF